MAPTEQKRGVDVENFDSGSLQAMAEAVQGLGKVLAGWLDKLAQVMEALKELVDKVVTAFEDRVLVPFWLWMKKTYKDAGSPYGDSDQAVNWWWSAQIAWVGITEGVRGHRLRRVKAKARGATLVIFQAKRLGLVRGLQP